MFKRKKKKTGCETPELRKYTPPPPPPTSGSNAVKTGSQVPSQYNPPPMPPVKPPKPPTSGSNAFKPTIYCGHQPSYTSTQNPPNVFSSVIKPEKEKEKRTMYGLKLYISFDDLNTYIHNHTDAKYKDHTFVPVKVEVNDLDLSIDISLISAGSVEVDQCRYKLNLNELPKENNKCKD